MADDNLIHLPQKPKRPKTGAERVRLHRERKRAAAANLPVPASMPATVLDPGQTRVTMCSPGEQFAPAETLHHVTPPFHAAPARRTVAPVMLGLAAFGLSMVGITMNGWYARSLGATDTAGLMFLAVGVAADLVALALPSVAARLWQTRQRTTAAVAWLVWLAVFAFALLSGVGFGSVNIADITAARGERVTASVAAARDGLADAVAARDRECKGGTGKFCRERESTVVDRRQALDAAMHEVAAVADPQTEGARRLVAWASRGTLAPSADDFAMVRLLLLSLLPQVGGILLMIGRRA